MTDRLRLLEPRGPAARWLRLVWEWPGYASGAAGDRILPHGLCEVSWELNRGHHLHGGGQGHRVRSAVFIGPMVSPYWVETPDRMHLFGMLFVPGVGRALIGSSVEHVRAAFTPFEDTPIGRQVMARVGAARTWSGRSRAAVSVFEALPDPSVGRATASLLRAWSTSRDRSVRGIRAELGMSAPTFVRQVRHDLGLRPGEVRQLARFRDALSRVASGARLAEAAAAAGYSDQAHMSRAFRRFTGLTPRQVRPRSPAHPFHLPEASFPFVQDRP